METKITTYTKKHDVTIKETIMSDVVKDELILHISSVLPDQYINTDNYYARLLLKATGMELLNKNGKLTKRILNELYKQHQVTPDDKWVGKLGNILKNLFTNNEPMSLHIVETNDFYQPADFFVNDSSCWWNSYTESRGLLYGSGGFGLVHVGGYSSKSRIWVLPHSGGHIMFNDYGVLTIPQWGKVVCELFYDGKDLEPVLYDMCSTGYREPYINGSDGYYVGENKPDGNKIYVDWNTDYKYEYPATKYCSNCGCECDEEYMCYSELTGEEYCDDCYSDQFYHCDDCGEEDYQNRSQNVRDNRGGYITICRRCYGNGDYYDCCDCGDTVHYEYGSTCESCDDFFCESCWDNHFLRCEFCDHNFCKEDLEEHDGCEFCSVDCVNDYKEQQEESESEEEEN